VSSGLLAEIKKVEENIKTKVSALLEKQSACWTLSLPVA
jgi:hypothetical protein